MDGEAKGATRFRIYAGVRPDGGSTSVTAVGICTPYANQGLKKTTPPQAA